MSITEDNYADIEAFETASGNGQGNTVVTYTCPASYGKTCNEKKVCDKNKNQICGDSKKCECKSGYEYDETNKECKLSASSKDDDDSSRSEFISYKFLFAFIFFILF